MRILVTGAAGFLGAALSNQLLRQGHTVIALDDLSKGHAQALLPDVQMVRGDINDRPQLWTLLQDIDCVYHLAARVSVPESVLYPREYNQVNVGGTVTLMEAMRDVGVRRVVFISSGAVYGNQETQPLREDAPPMPGSPYAVSKLSAEHYVATIGRLWKIETVILRVFNAYGPGQQVPPVHAPVIPNYLRQAWFNGTIVVHGSGSQTRDFIYIDDVVQAMLAAATVPEANGRILNIGSGVETTIREVARLAVETTGCSPELIFNPRNDGGVKRMCAEITPAMHVLAYRPTISLPEGIRRTFEADIRVMPRPERHA